MPCGRDFESAVNSARLFASAPGFTTATIGGPPNNATWVKSLTGSNGAFPIAGAMTCEAMLETTSV